MLPSKLAGLHKILGEDDPACLDFDFACMLRLHQYDVMRDEAQAKRIAYEVSKIFSVSDDNSGGEVNPDAFDAGAQVW